MNSKYSPAELFANMQFENVPLPMTANTEPPVAAAKSISWHEDVVIAVAPVFCIKEQEDRASTL
jgi:hypothetical protein